MIIYSFQGTPASQTRNQKINTFVPLQRQQTPTTTAARVEIEPQWGDLPVEASGSGSGRTPQAGGSKGDGGARREEE